MGIESTSQPTACSSSPLNRAYLTERYRSCLLLATCLAWAASVVNLGVLAWASAAKDGRVYTSTCTDVENINTAIHLTINALSTILLMSSIYCMRRVTRSSIDGARAQRWWAKVDFQSNRYQKLAKNREAVCWCILAILALTLHVFYNSVFHVTVAQNAFTAVVVDGQLPATVSEFNRTWPVKDADLAFIEGLLTNSSSFPNGFERLDAAQCTREYSQDILSYRSNLVLIVEPETGYKLSIPQVLDVKDIQTAPTNGVGRGAHEWLPSNRTRYWSTGASKSDYYYLKGCMSQKVKHECSVQFNQPLGIAVALLSLIQAAGILFVFLQNEGRPWVTAGNAVAPSAHSPYQRLDARTSAIAAEEKQEWNWHIDRRMSLKREFFATEWYSPGPSGHISLLRIIFSTFGVTMLSFSLGNIYYSVSSSSWGMTAGFGKFTAHQVIIGRAGTTWSTVPAALTANAPQAILSLLHLVCSDIFLRKWGSSAERGREASAGPTPYLLQPRHRQLFISLMTLTAISLHWHASLSTHLLDIESYDRLGNPHPAHNSVVWAYSPVAMLCSAIAGGVLLTGAMAVL
ncbi:hypothetical protein B0J12DRAFT_349686 [Macrophomina phaseolina]|uniref:DUF6536 domain-containing protein n=1 Tax=Macrophomina phaseolina TaxID=35725 RepID=A0ABQ8GMP6_9PEZI|nr:hypothetical protein B0J12DRAFT_349686 [Macrophomina phaseolina]